MRHLHTHSRTLMQFTVEGYFFQPNTFIVSMGNLDSTVKIGPIFIHSKPNNQAMVVFWMRMCRELSYLVITEPL